MSSVNLKVVGADQSPLDCLLNIWAGLKGGGTWEI